MAFPRDRNIPKEPVEGPFTLFLWGKEKFDRRKSILKAFTSNPIFSKTSVVLPSLARKDAWTRSALQARELIRIKLSQGWSHTQFMEAIRLTDNMLPVQPQFRIFLSNLERQMSDDQKAIWVTKAERFEIFGSYVSGLGYNSDCNTNVKRLLTYNPRLKLNSGTDRTCEELKRLRHLIKIEMSLSSIHQRSAVPNIGSEQQVSG